MYNLYIGFQAHFKVQASEDFHFYAFVDQEWSNGIECVLNVMWFI